MYKLIGYIPITSSSYLHFAIPVFEMKGDFYFSVLDENDYRISKFDKISRQGYLPIESDITVETDDLYVFIYSQDNKIGFGNIYEVAQKLLLLSNLDFLKSIEKYELFSLLNLYHETQDAADRYAKELNITGIDSRSFDLPELIKLDKKNLWDVINHYGKLLSFCQNSLSINQIIRVFSSTTVCLGNYLIQVDDINKTFINYGHLTKDFAHDILIYLVRFSGLDKDFCENENYRLYNLFEIPLMASEAIKHNKILAKNSQSHIFNLEHNAVYLSYQVDKKIYDISRGKSKYLLDKPIDILDVLSISENVLVNENLVDAD